MLQKQLKQKQDSIQRSLGMRNSRLAQLLGKEQKKEDSEQDTESAESVEGAVESIESVNEQLDQVENKVRLRLLEEEQGKLSTDPV